MPPNRQHLLSKLLAQPRIQASQEALAQHCVNALVEQGLEVQGGTREAQIDTGVGRMRRLSVELLEPLSKGLVELQVYLLAKVDGSVHCWSELWGAPRGREAQPSVRRASTGAAVGVESPARLRLARKNHFEGSLGKVWARQPDAVVAAEGHLAEQGLFAAVSESSLGAIELAQAVTA